jgi:ribosome maturation factor RimP
LKDIEKKILDEIEPLLQSMNIAIVEINVAVVNKRFTVRLVIFQENGVSLEDCAAVHRVLKPRLGLILESRDLSIEITSPGIDRKIKSSREYTVFRGKALRILLENESDWISGWIENSTEDAVILKVDDEVKEIPLHAIRKAKLDYTMEGR